MTEMLFQSFPDSYEYKLVSNGAKYDNGQEAHKVLQGYKYFLALFPAPSVK